MLAIPSEDTSEGSRLLQFYDIDGNGRIDYDEILALFQDCINTTGSTSSDPVSIRKEFYERYGGAFSPRQTTFDIDHLLTFLKNKFGDRIFHNLFINMSNNTIISRQMNIRRTLTGGGSLSRSASSSVNSHDNSMILCDVCFEPRVAMDVYGHREFPYPRNCNCNANICVICLEANSLIQMSVGRKILCPGYDERRKICGRALKPQLTNMFFKNMCTLCKEPLNESSISAGCAFDHQFCKSCLQLFVSTKLDEKSELICPRYAQCKFILDEESIKNIFEDNEERKHVLIRWRDSKITDIISRHELMKRCNTTDCNGYIRGNIDMVKFSESKCNECNVSRCFDCADYYHYGRSCEEVMGSKVSWDNFLLQLAKTYPDIQMSAAVSAIEDNMKNAEYFRQKISQGLLRKCPGCARITQKTVQSCNQVKCGENAHGGNRQAGCDLTFDWSRAPIVSIEEYLGDVNSIRVGDIAALNLSDMQVDITLGLDSENRVQVVKCTTCLDPICGTRFDCVYCSNPRSSLCFKCMGESLKGGGQHRNHHFEIVNPIKKPSSNNFKLLQCCLTSTGAIQVHNLANIPHEVGATTVATRPREWAVKYCTVRIDIFPNGNIVFADDYGKACRCLVLDNIAFPLQGTDSDALCLRQEIVSSSSPLRVYKNNKSLHLCGEVTVTGTPSTTSSPYPIARHLNGCSIFLKSSYCQGGIGIDSVKTNRSIHFPQVKAPEKKVITKAYRSYEDDTISTTYHTEHILNKTTGNRVASATCDICRHSGISAYFCAECDFDVCKPCLNKELGLEYPTFHRWEITSASGANVAGKDFVMLFLGVNAHERYSLMCSKVVRDSCRELYVCKPDSRHIPDNDIFVIEVDSGTSRIRLKSVIYNQYVYVHCDNHGKYSLGLWAGGDDAAIIDQQYFFYEIQFNNQGIPFPPNASTISITPHDQICSLASDAPKDKAVFMGALAADNTLHLHLNYLPNSASKGVVIPTRDGYVDDLSCPVQLLQYDNIRHLKGSVWKDPIYYDGGFMLNSEILHLPTGDGGSNDYWGHFLVMMDSGFDGSSYMGTAVVSLEGDVLKFLCFTQDTIDQYGDLLAEFRRMILDIHYCPNMAAPITAPNATKESDGYSQGVDGLAPGYENLIQEARLAVAADRANDLARLGSGSGQAIEQVKFTGQRAFDIILPKGVVTPPRSEEIMNSLSSNEQRRRNAGGGRFGGRNNNNNNGGRGGYGGRGHHPRYDRPYPGPGPNVFGEMRFGAPLPLGNYGMGGYNIPPFDPNYQYQNMPRNPVTPTENDRVNSDKADGCRNYRSFAYTDGKLCHLSGVVEKVRSLSAGEGVSVWNNGDIIGKLPETMHPASKVSFVTIAERVNWQGLDINRQQRNNHGYNNMNGPMRDMPEDDEFD